MNRDTIIEAFSSIGIFLSQFESFHSEKTNIILNKKFYEPFSSAITSAKTHNGWFEEKQVRRALGALSSWLKPNVLKEWSSKYKWSDGPKKVAIVMAGNIPLVGFHDFVCTLLSGHHVIVKLSSEDKILLPLIVKMLVDLNPVFGQIIFFTESRMKDFDAVIATGSDNTARYFNYYFAKYPHIIRKNRNSVAVLSGNENLRELEFLGDDVFAYYGLGCRNVSKLYVPIGYDFEMLFEAFYKYKDVIDNKKYANNFDYYRALFLMGGNEIVENGFMLLREDSSITSPISVLHYEFYNDLDEVKKCLSSKPNEIQCIVSTFDIENSFDFGQAQIPAIDDYADGVDTMEFLMNL